MCDPQSIQKILGRDGHSRAHAAQKVRAASRPGFFEYDTLKIARHFATDILNSPARSTGPAFIILTPIVLLWSHLFRIRSRMTSDTRLWF